MGKVLLWAVLEALIVRPTGLKTQVREHPLDHRLLKDRRDDLQFATAVRAVLQVDLEHAPEQLGPIHQLGYSEPAVGEDQLVADAGSSVRRVRRHFADVQDRVLTGRFEASSSESLPSEVGQKPAVVTVSFLAGYSG